MPSKKKPPMPEPLFSVKPVPKRQTAKAEKAVEFGECPGHTGGRTGLERNGEHLYWRDHTVKTWSGTNRICAASHQRLCDRPTRTGHPSCPCQGNGRSYL
jgi:hypothetical protein